MIHNFEHEHERKPFVIMHHRPDPDSAIRQTDLDASQSRLSAVRTNYMEDPFIHLLVPRAFAVPARPPLIHVGTYIRSEAIDRLISSWLEIDTGDSRKQIITLGAGSDTRFWRLSVSYLPLLKLSRNS